VRRRPRGGKNPNRAGSPPPNDNELLAVGRVTRTHGVRGEVAVQPLSEVESRFQGGSVLLLGPAGDRRLTVREARSHGHRLLVRFEEIADLGEAESLRGRLLLVRAEDAPPLPADRYWVHELVGLEVLTEMGRTLGKIREVLHNPANDVWLVEGDDGEVLVPALRDVIAEVDPMAGRVVIREVPGLLGEDS
jgi:16S rRNA processing protein RimM